MLAFDAFPARSATLALIALFVSACAVVPLHTRGQRSPDPPHVLGRKLVVGKEVPLDLIAEDGTRCLTTKKRYERTRIGSKVWCVWEGEPAPGYH
ncbi:MAG: hypothetical protein ACT4PJ_06740 [Gemmatimonadaceae bacterium]